MVATTLRAGALALVSYATDDTDSANDDVLRFVVLSPIGDGTTIFFTDRAWTPKAGSTKLNEGSFAAASTGEGTFTFTAAQNYAVGDVITITSAQLAGAGINLSDTSGETIYVFQGPDASTPTEFLLAADIADGNTTFNGSLVNTGLSTAAGTAIAVGHDNASFGGHATGSAQHQLAEIADVANNWHGSDQGENPGTLYDDRADVRVSGPLSAPDMQLFGAMTGGGQSDAIVRIDNDEASNVGTNLTRLLRDNPAFVSMEDIAFDLEDGVWFAVMNEGTDITRIIKGNIADLTNTGGTPTFTTIYEYDNDAADSDDDKFIQGIELDKNANRIFFTLGDLIGGHNFMSVDYSGGSLRDWGAIAEANDPTFGFAGGIEDFAIDTINNTAYFSYVLVDAATPEILHNYVVKLSTPLDAAAPVPTADHYAIVPIANALPADANWPAGRIPPAEGSIRGIDFDPSGGAGTLWFVTAGVGASGNGGIFKLNLATLQMSEVWNQPGNNAHFTPQSFPTTLLHDIEVDSIGGRYYVSDQNETNTADDTTPGDENGGNIWSGSLNAAPGTAPTLFADIYEPTANGAVKGMEINYAPTVTALASANATYTESTNGPNSPAGAALDVGGAPTIGDVDTTNLKGAVVAINGFVPGDLLGFTLSGGITGSYNASTGVLTLTGSASYAQYSAVLDTVTFTNAGDNPTDFGGSTSRQITFQVTDGLAYSDPASVTVNVVGINDAPVNTPGAAIFFTEDTTGRIGNDASTTPVSTPAVAPVNAITGISVFDVDANPSTQDIQVTLSVANGVLTIRTDVAGGLAAGEVSGNGTATLVLTGTQNQINMTLEAVNASSQANGLVYTPNANFNGADPLTITTNDLGNNGNDPGGLSGGPTDEADIDVKTLNVADVNDAPTVTDTTQDSPTILEDTPLTNLNAPTAATLFGASFSDALDVQVNAATNPSGSAGDTLAGIAIVANDSNANGQWQWHNGSAWMDIGAVSVDAAKTFAAGTLIRFNPALNYNGAAPTLSARLIESSATAVTNNATVDLNPAPPTTGNAAIYSAGTVTLSQTVTAVNDAPVNTVGAALNINEDAPAANLTGISIADVDANAASDLVSVTLDVDHGTLAILTAVAGGIVAADIVSQDADTITISATRNKINTTLAAAGGLTYTADANYNGADRLRVTTNDNGFSGQDPVPGTGTATSEQDEDDKAINIASVNDAPSGADKLDVAINEDATYTFAQGDFGFSDAIDGNLMAGVEIVTLPGAGTLTLNGVALSALTVVSAQDIADGKFKYTPDANTSGDNYSSFTFKVIDDGASGGLNVNKDGSADTYGFDVASVNDAPVVTISPSIPGAAELVKRTLFVANDGVSGPALWISDGTAAGTRLLKDIGRGFDDPQIGGFRSLADGRVIFRANDGANGHELWITDGTSAGTSLLKDLVAGAVGSFPDSLITVGNKALFNTFSGPSGPSLWITDGTESGTRMLIDYDPAGTAFISFTGAVTFGQKVLIGTNFSGGSLFVVDMATEQAERISVQTSDATDFVAVGDKVLFAAQSATQGRELWVSDGTTAGTMVLKDILPGASSSFPDDLTRLGDKVLFRADDGASGSEMWISDGTAAGTMLLKDITPGSTGSNPQQFWVLGDRLLFNANGDLWSSDGTAAGTRFIADVGPLTQNTFKPVVLDGKLIFAGSVSGSGTEIWSTDGTSAGTILLKDIRAGADSSTPQHFQIVGDKVIFMANDNVVGNEPWITDGTPGGTVLLKDFRPGNGFGSSDTNFFAPMGPTVIFSAVDTVEGFELHVSDGTAGGTFAIDIAKERTADASPTGLFTLAGKLVFFADDSSFRSKLWTLEDDQSLPQAVAFAGAPFLDPVGPAVTIGSKRVFFASSTQADGSTAFGFEPWVTDGSAAGTFLLRDIVAGSDPSFAGGGGTQMVALGSKAIFTAFTAAQGVELWGTDGSSAGTILLKDIRPGTGTSGVSLTASAVVGNKLVFSANDGTNGAELWVTDGTSGGTVMLRNISSSGDSSPRNFFAVNGKAYFSATDPTNGGELWVTDGTVGGTALLKDINAGTASSSPIPFVSVGTKVLFSAIDTVNGRELWATDGTAAGTVLLKDITAGVGGSLFTAGVEAGGKYFFGASDDVVGTELWVTDGTVAGTQRLADIQPGIGSSTPQRFIAFGDKVIFIAQGPEGQELYVTDGTSAGTSLLKDIKADGSSSPASLKVYGDKVIFVADDGVHGLELWSTDGTSAGTILLKDIHAGTNGAGIGNFSTNNFATGETFIEHEGKLYFYATDGAKGRELWVTDGTAAGTRMVDDLNLFEFGSGPTGLFVSEFLQAGAPTPVNEFTATEQQPLSLKGSISVADVDAEAGVLTATLSIGYGSLAVTAGGSGAQIVSSDGATVVISGTLAQINALLSTDATSTVTFTPNTDAPPASTTLTLSVNDHGNSGRDPGASGGETNEIGSASAVIAIRAVNDAPSGANKTLTASEDDPLTIAWSDLGFSDPLDNHVPVSVVITQLATNGLLKLNGANVTLNQVISKADIDNNLLVFLPDPDESGTAYATFEFAVRDAGGTANSGVDTDQSPNTITINVTADNFAPVLDLDDATGGKNFAANYTEDGAAAPIVGNVVITDNENDQITGATVTIEDTRAGDTLALAGLLPVGISSSVAEVDGKVVRTLTGAASADDYEAALELVRFSSTSQDPTAADTAAFRTISTTITDATGTSLPAFTGLAITAVNDAPVNANVGADGGTEDTSFAITGLSVSDADAGANDITVTLGVSRGTLDIATNVANGVEASDVTDDGTGTVKITASQSQINTTLAAMNGLLFNGGANANGNVTLTVTSNDGGATGTGGGKEDQDQYTISITGVNDAPVVIGDGTEDLTTIAEDTPSPGGQTVFSLLGGQYSDAADSQAAFGGTSPGNFSGIAVVANGSSASAGQWQWLDNGTWTDIGAASAGAAKLFSNTTAIRFSPTANFNGQAPTLEVRLLDNSPPAITNGSSVDLSAPGAVGGTTRYSAGTVSIGQTVTAVSDAPVGTNHAIAINEDAPRVLSAADFPFTDVENNALVSVTIDSVSGGVILFDADGAGAGAPAQATLAMTFTLADLNAGKVVFQPTAHLNGAGAGTIAFRVRDDGGTSPGQDTDASASTLTVNIASVNDAPTSSNQVRTIIENTDYVFSVADFPFSDIDGNVFSRIGISFAGMNGTLLFDTDGAGPNAPSPAGGVTGPISLLDEGRIIFRPDANEIGDGYAVLTFAVIDDGGSANGGKPFSISHSFTFNVAPDKRPPVAVDDSASAVEDSGTSGNVLTNDTDPNNDPLTVVGVSFAGVAGTVGQAIKGKYGTLTLNADGSYSYAADQDLLDTIPTGTAGLTDVFTYEVSDNVSGSDTGTLTIDVSTAADDVTTNGTTGHDTIRGDARGRTGAEDTISGGSGNDTLYGLAGADRLHGGTGSDFLFGGEGWDDLFGADGNDLLDGGAGKDSLDGGSGTDQLFGRAGADRLLGGSGNDLIDGGAGDDVLAGGSGYDLFIFLSGEHIGRQGGDHDLITDFQVNLDKIDLSAIYGARGTVTLTQGTNPGAFGLATFKDGGSTWVVGDVDGDGSADFGLELAGSLTLKLSDFVLNQTQWNAHFGRLGQPAPDYSLLHTEPLV